MSRTAVSTQRLNLSLGAETQKQGRTSHYFRSAQTSTRSSGGEADSKPYSVGGIGLYAPSGGEIPASSFTYCFA
jgi:hypothetical protein